MPIFKPHFLWQMAQKLVVKILFISTLFLLQELSCAQPSYQFTLSTSREICLKAAAALDISGTDASDTISIAWSTGVTDLYKVQDLAGGAYQVRIVIKHHQDTLLFVKDTTLYFTIEKELCVVSVDKYFSPNDDNYHDLMGIVNAQYHPEFELNIFNKWGQRVHVQKHQYTPWDGKWNGIDLPDGTYYYIFFYNEADKTNLVKGDVTILR